MKRLMVVIFFIVTSILPTDVHVTHDLSEQEEHGATSCDDHAIDATELAAEFCDIMEPPEEESAFYSWLHDSGVYLLLKWIVIKDFFSDKWDAISEKVVR